MTTRNLLRLGVLTPVLLLDIGGAGAQTVITSPPPPAAPPSPCTNAPEASCATIAGCVWLPGYKVKGAPDVPGYCRPAPKPLSSRRPATPPPKQ